MSSITKEELIESINEAVDREHAILMIEEFLKDKVITQRADTIYEWQWSYLEQGSNPMWEMSAYMTDSEFDSCGISHIDFKAVKCEWTKKERKQ